MAPKNADVSVVWGALAGLIEALTRIANAFADQIEKEGKAGK